MYRYLEGSFASVGEIASKPHARAGIAKVIDRANAARAGDYALEFRGHVVVAAAGVYRFSVTSDDGSALDVAGRRIVDNDGTHPARERGGEIALGPGPHPFRLLFFQGGGGAALSVFVEGPGLSRRELGGEMLVASDDDVCAAKLVECPR